MSLNLEGFRIEIARAMYEDSIGGLKGAPGWFEQQADVRDGFIKLAAAGLAKVFEKDPKDLVEFFAGHVLATSLGCGDELTDWIDGETVLCGKKDRAQHKILCADCKVKALTHET